MGEGSAAREAERLSLRRARILPVLVIIYFSQQAAFFTQQHGADPARGVDHVKIGAWVVLSLVLLAALMTKGFWFRSREVREMIDDETTRDHRRNGIETGFLIAMLSAIGLYFLSMVEPVGVREAIHIIVSLGLGFALIRFAFLERRAHRGG